MRKRERETDRKIRIHVDLKCVQIDVSIYCPTTSDTNLIIILVLENSKNLSYGKVLKFLNSDTFSFIRLNQLNVYYVPYQVKSLIVKRIQFACHFFYYIKPV